MLTFARATNLGASRATGTFLFLLNDDAAVEGRAVERLAQAFAAEPGMGAVGGYLVNPDGSPQPSAYAYPSWRALAELILRPVFRFPPLGRLARYPYPRPPAREGAEFWLSGAALMVRRKLFEEVGGLDDGYPHGVEDAVLCRAMRERGYSVAVVPDARILHGGGTSGYWSRVSSERVSKALIGGAAGWLRYWEVNGAGRLSRTALRLALLLFGLSRLVAYAIGSLVPGPWHERQRFRRDAYLGYMRWILSGRGNDAQSAQA